MAEILQLHEVGLDASILQMNVAVDYNTSPRTSLGAGRHVCWFLYMVRELISLRSQHPFAAAAHLVKMLVLLGQSVL